MNTDSNQIPLRESFKDVTGVYDYRITPVYPLDPVHQERLEEWLDAGHNAGMEYMARYGDMRTNPEMLLEGTRSMIVCAYNYIPRRFRDRSLPQIASFAYGEDYHDVIRRRLSKGVELLKDRLGGEWRICVDSAPIFERAWAERSGLGKRCDNGLIALPGAGTRILLAEILTTVDYSELRREFHRSPVKATEDLCLHCGACVRACPTGALQEDSTVDAGRCLSYLTIEHKGEFPEWVKEEDVDVPLFGCDRCQDACPLNNPLLYPIAPTEIEEFEPSDFILTLDRGEVLQMTQADFSRLFRGSAIKRAKLAGLRRNATYRSLGS